MTYLLLTEGMTKEDQFGPLRQNRLPSICENYHDDILNPLTANVPII